MARTQDEDAGGLSGRTIGLLLAGAFSLAVGGLLAWSLWSAADELSPQESEAPDSVFDDAPAPDDLEGDAAPGGDVQDVLAAAEKGRIELVDENNRVTRELVYESLDPRRGGRVHVAQPRAWLHLDGGRVAHLRSAEAMMVRPPGRREPESGRFEKNVVLRLYERDPRQTPQIEPGESAAVVSVYTDSLSFDSAMGELRTSAPVRIEAEGFETNITGLTLMFDESQRRLAYLRTDHGGEVRVTRRGAESNEEDEPGRKSASAENAPRQAEAPANAREDLYHAKMRGEVAVAAGPRSIDAEQLDLWARLLEGEPTNTVIEGLSVFGRSAEDQSVTANDGEPPANQTSDQPAEPLTHDDEVRVTWTGPLVVEPVDSRPIELKDRDALARFTAPSRGAVIIADEEADAEARAVSLEYAPDERTLTLTGAGPTGVTLTLTDSAEITTGRFQLNIETGLAEMPGPGALRTIGAAQRRARRDQPDSPPPQVAWQRRAELSLAAKDGALDLAAENWLREAIFTGGVEAHNGELFLQGERVRSVFAASDDGEPLLSRVVVQGEARAEAGDDGSVTADRLDVEFDRGAQPPLTPTIATAQGDARVQRDGATLRADLTEARFSRDDAGALRVDSFNADLGVVVRSAGDVEAEADSLRARPPSGVVDLVGEPASLRRGPASITGRSMRLEENERRLTVFGAGTLSRTQPRGRGLGYERVQLEWTDSMTYDDRAGRAEFIGECVATADASELARDTLTAERIVMLVEPGTAARTDRNEEIGDRALKRATAYGESIETEGADGDHAEVESRRYKLDDSTESGLALTRLLYLEGPKIIAEGGDEHRLRVPATGRLLIEDRRGGSPEAAPNEATVRGTSLFEWDGSLTLNRFTGQGVMERRVRLRHRPPGEQRITEIECERLTTKLTLDEEDSAASSGAASRPELVWAEATGAVYAKQGDRELIADRLLYDGGLGVAEATAAQGNRITLFDASSGVPMSGDLLRWDLRRDRVEWRGADAVAAPD